MHVNGKQNRNRSSLEPPGMATPSPHNNKAIYALIALTFFILFVFSIFLLIGRSLSPSLSLYRQHVSSSSTDSPSDSTSTDPGGPSLSSTQQPISPNSQFQTPDSVDNIINGDQLNVEENKHQGEEIGIEGDPGLDEEKETSPVTGSGVDESLRKCDLYMGNWVKDELEHPIYQPGSCPYIDEAFDCQPNGRPDSGYLKWRWKPDGCDLPRFNATDFLERLRGKRLMLVGDSMNRNQYESLLCMLHESLNDKSRMYETHGYKLSKKRGYFVFKFEDYNCTVEFVRSHFLVEEGSRVNSRGKSNPTLSIDRIDKTSGKWKRADILVFNTGHWWAHGRNSRGKNYYKEGDYVYPKLDAIEAFRRAIKTWAQWIDQNVDPKKLVMYRGYSSAHFRGGEWDSGGSCRGETEPVYSGAILNKYPFKMKIVEEVIQEMKFPVILVNVTSLTNFRKDGHPSVYGVRAKKKQDCSHWCIPGVPDAWNELTYASLLLQQTTDH